MKEDRIEINAWGRLIAQTFIYWYTGFFAFNAIGLGWIISANRARQLWIVCCTFILFNLLGVVSSTFVALYGRDAHRRLAGAGEFVSPFPIRLWNGITVNCAISLVAMAAAWIGVLAKP
jgi:hypothetical protein